MKHIATKFLYYQVLSRPLLVLSIATVFTDQPQCSDGTSDCVADPDSEVVSAELSPAQPILNTRYMIRSFMMRS